MPFLDNIHRKIRQHRLLSPGETVIVGVSGGADSIVLLHVLHALQTTFSVTLHVATLDHGWRGAASVADADYVVGWAERLNLPVTRRRADLSDADSGQEAAARRARYTFFAAVARSVGARTVAVGHHADDQAETVLMAILRGAGVHGLGGMRWIAPLPYADDDLRLVRPLLGVTRAEIDAYCAAHDLHPREDATNNDPTYWRNRVRLDVLPYLDDLVDGNVRGRLSQLADIAGVESDFVAQEVTRWFTENAHEQSPRWTIDRAAFLAAHPAIQRRVLRRLVEQVGGGVDYAHIVQAQQLAQSGQTGAVAQFGDRVQVRVGYSALIVEPEHAPDVPPVAMPVGVVLSVTVGKPVQLGERALTLAADSGQGGEVIGQLYLPVGAALQLRTRQPGDRIAPPGMNGRTRKLKDWLIDRKIPAAHRDRLPLLICDGKIAAVIHPTHGIVAHPYHLATSGAENQRLSLILS